MTLVLLLPARPELALEDWIQLGGAVTTTAYSKSLAVRLIFSKAMEPCGLSPLWAAGGLRALPRASFTAFIP